MKKSLVIFLLFSSACLFGQPKVYTTANVHSHNDYEQKIPFWLAYNNGLGSIEADIFLENGELLVAHETKELVLHRTLQEYYLDNLLQCVEKNKGYPFTDTLKRLQVLIDIKTDSITTLDKLITVLKGYPGLINNPKLSFVITGNRPAAFLWINYPPFIQFDAVLSESYSKNVLQRVVMFSDNFKNFSQWKGNGAIPSKDRKRLLSLIRKAHQVNIPVRFWNAPDFSNAWRQLMKLKVDYLNTDHIAEIAAFLELSHK